MSTLLISMTGGNRPGEAPTGHGTPRYRLPVGERIVATENLGIELARALQARKLVLAGSSAACFDRLIALLPPEAAEAPVAEVAPPAAAEETPAEGAAEEAVAPAAEAPPAKPEGAEPPAPPEVAEKPPEEPPSDPAAGDAVPEPAASESAPPVSEGEGSTVEAPDAVPAPEAVPAPDTAAAPDAEAGPAAAEDTPAATEAPEHPVAESAPAEAEATPGADADAAEPEVAQILPTPLPHEVHKPDTRSLSERLAQQARTGRPDSAALNALAERLREALGMEEIHCVMVTPTLDRRGFQATLRTLVEIPEEGDAVHIDVSNGGTAASVIGLLAMNYLQTFRPEVRTGRVFQAAPEETDDNGVTPIRDLEAPLEMMDLMGMFREISQGRAPVQAQKLFSSDRYLKPLAGPFVRFERGVRFGALAEVIQGARLFDDRRRKLRRLPYSHSFHLFDPVMRAAVSPFLEEAERLSERQLLMAFQAFNVGSHPRAALHLREALVSACLEAYGQDPARTWVDVPGSGGAQQVRLREVAGYVLSTDEFRRTIADLSLAWPLLATARNRYVNLSPTAVGASQLKAYDHEIGRLLQMVASCVQDTKLVQAAEQVSLDDAIKRGIDLRSIRPRERRPPRRRTGQGPPDREEGRREGGREGGGEDQPRRSGYRDRPAGPPRDRDRDRDRDRGRDRDRDRDRGGPGGRRGERPPAPRRPRQVADGRPRVERVGGGLGNLGLALRHAGIGAARSAAGADEQPPARPDQSTPPPAPESTAPEAAAARPVESSPVESPAPETQVAPPTAPKPQESGETPRKEESPGFDVAGPVPPAES